MNFINLLDLETPLSLHRPILELCCTYDSSPEVMTRHLLRNINNHSLRDCRILDENCSVPHVRIVPQDTDKSFPHRLNPHGTKQPIASIIQICLISVENDLASG